MSLYNKIQIIQNKVTDLIKKEENKFQKYFFFNELQVMQIIKPLLEENKIALLISDDISQPFIHEISQEKKEHFIKYLKKLEIIDIENNEKKVLNFWACSSHSDLAKAKGSADTYSIKYALSKLFLIPVKDNTDPDYDDKKEKDFRRIENFFS